MIYKKLTVYWLLLDKLKFSNNIALISHKNPDIDTIWSATAFYEIISDNFSNKKADLICIDSIPNNFKFLKNTLIYKKDFNPDDYDLIVFFDSWSKYQSWYYEKYNKLFDSKKYNTISIDHHHTNELYAKQNILNTTYSSTTMIVFEIFFIMWLKISSISATNLLAWIYSDTWWYKHSNTDKVTFFMAALLKKIWADHNLIVNKLFKANDLSTIKLWWKILSNSFINDEWILYSYVNKTMLDSYNCDYHNITWVIDYLNTAEGIKYSTLLTQKWEFVKASLRTLRDDIDLTQIAKKYDWWWHKKASWFTTKVNLQEFKTFNLKI